jgi:hypothetical protein
LQAVVETDVFSASVTATTKSSALFIPAGRACPMPSGSASFSEETGVTTVPHHAGPDRRVAVEGGRLMTATGRPTKLDDIKAQRDVCGSQKDLAATNERHRRS